VFLAACGGGSSSSGGSGDKERLIVVLGDSIGLGECTNIAFPDIIESLTGVPVINNSTGGISAEEGVSRAQDLIDKHNPRVIVSLLGTNNVSWGGVGGAINAMQSLAQICEDNGVICIIGTLPPITNSNRGNNDINAINDGYRAIGGVRIADNNAVMTGSNICSDGVHPNSSGQQIIGETFSAQF
ncbi:MAG: hypothetical protein GY726_08360, partial [Proteobacteria bacterium]|nr:hypothetical protein [Pseudomonadota bacterium]